MESLIRPGESARARRWLLLLAPALLIAAATIEMIVTPTDLWGTRLLGHNALHCLTVIPILSLAPTVFLFLVMRHGAPDHPGQAGAIAALASAGIAATLYASIAPTTVRCSSQPGIQSPYSLWPLRAILQADAF